MSAITLATLRDTVRFRGDYQNVRKFSDANLNIEIQQSFGEFYELVADTNEGFWDTSATVATTANTTYVALPTDAWRVQGVDRLDGGDYVELQQVSVSERNRFGSSATGEPSIYRLTARGIELLPTPDAIYTLRVLYTPLAPALTESQPREWYNGWEDYVVTATLLRLDQREQRPLADRLAILERAKQRIISGASKRKQQEPEYLNLRESTAFDMWDERWR